ncbi:MAG: YqcC family protein [Alcanivorax sp.]|nr:YqcC family protein [Alcanivorax sp.]
MTNDQRQALAGLLNDMQAEMEGLRLWDTLPPEPAAFQSATPFFADTMKFTQWLQWVFIARFRAILAEDHPLPAQCDVAPLAEETLRDVPEDTDRLVALIRDFDAHF